MARAWTESGYLMGVCRIRTSRAGRKKLEKAPGASMARAAQCQSDPMIFGYRPIANRPTRIQAPQFLPQEHLHRSRLIC